MGNQETIDGGRLPIDLERLSQNTINDPALTRDILQLFCEEAGEWLKALATAPSLDAWKAAAHTMKGASGSIAAWELVDAAKAAESLTALDAPERKDLFAEVERAMTRATRYAGQLLADSPFAG